MKLARPRRVLALKVSKSWSMSTGEVVLVCGIVASSGISGSEFGPGAIET
jgi:hypothetical protein